MKKNKEFLLEIGAKEEKLCKEKKEHYRRLVCVLSNLQ